MASSAHRTTRKRAKSPKKSARKPSNAALLKLAAKHRPPQSWFEQTDVPFTPAKD